MVRSGPIHNRLQSGNFLDHFKSCSEPSERARSFGQRAFRTSTVVWSASPHACLVVMMNHFIPADFQSVLYCSKSIRFDFVFNVGQRHMHSERRASWRKGGPRSFLHMGCFSGRIACYGNGNTRQEHTDQKDTQPKANEEHQSVRGPYRSVGRCTERAPRDCNKAIAL
jgi:hypothetical protein